MVTSVYAQTLPEPERCNTPQGTFDCLPTDGSTTDSGEVNPPGVSKRCAESYEEWLQNPRMSYWVNDEQVTAAWKEGERSRQFLYWILSHKSIDKAPVLLAIWGVSRNIAVFLLVLVAMFMGLGVIIGRFNIGIISDLQSRVNIMPLFRKLFLLILFVVMSATFFLIIVEISDILMEFFIKRMGGNQLFNIFYLDTTGTGIDASEKSYQQFQGCRNLNVNVLESYRTSMFLIRFTNMSYYAIGIMMILRKIILWFLMFVSPFLALLMPFTFIRNTGWIWIGVFFQWVFYGPLFGLFLGGMRFIWNDAIIHIPYIFDFSRRNGSNIRDVIYPTAINILYGGPAQNQSDPISRLGIRNTSSYVDTFVEYVISLIMMWTAVLLPWLLLRIFRDYCCEGIYAMKNFLMAMYDKPSPGAPPPSSPTPSPVQTFGTSRAVDEEKTTVEKTRLETITEIKKASTEEIHRSMNVYVSKLTDIARFETDKIAHETVTKNIEYLKNPMSAETAVDRQRFMNIRTELSERAMKGDEVAKRTMMVLSSKFSKDISDKKSILHSIPVLEKTQNLEQIVQNISSQTGAPINTTSQVINTYYQTISNNKQTVQSIAQTTNTSTQNVENVLKNMSEVTTVNTPVHQVIQTLAQKSGVSEDKVREIIRESSVAAKSSSLINTVSTLQQISRDTVEKLVDTIPQVVVQTVLKEPISQKVSEKTNIDTQQSNNVINNLFTQFAQDNRMVQLVTSETNIPSEQVVSVVNQFIQHNQTQNNFQDVLQNISNNTSLKEEQIKQVIKTVAETIKNNNTIVKKVADAHKTTDVVVEKAIAEQVPAIIAPQKDTIASIEVPPTIPIEEYEQTKSMWVNHYEKGEIPETENITSRKDWVMSDVITITNILNKLVSPNEEIRLQGIDEVGYILPIFMINKLSGAELLVYLKTKLEAAKQVQHDLEKEEEIKAKLEKKDEEEKIEVKRETKKEKEKELQMEEELPEEEKDEQKNTTENMNN